MLKISILLIVYAIQKDRIFSQYAIRNTRYDNILGGGEINGRKKRSSY